MMKYKILMNISIVLIAIILASVGIADIGSSGKNPEVLIYAFDQNPAGSDKGNEWVAFHNPSNEIEDIGNWILETTHGSIVAETIPIGTILYPGAYYIYTPPYLWLDNEDESVIFKDPEGKEVDRTPVLSDTKNDNRCWVRKDSKWVFEVREEFVKPTPIPSLSPSPTPVLSFWYSVYFVPDDECEQYMVELINSANSTVYAALYDIKLNNVSDALIDAYENRSIDVKVVTDDKCANHADSMYKHDIIKTDFKISDFMHNKFIVVDNRTVWTGSMNPTLNGAYYNNNNVIVINSTELACDYRTEFFEMWNGSFSKGSPANTPYPIIYINGTEIECYFAPEDGVEAQIIEELMSANNSVYFAIFTFTSKPIAETLIDLHNQGVKVKGIYEKRQNSTYCTYHLLHGAGIEVIWDKNPKTMHHKFFLIDNTTTITGSYNPTKHANTGNDENILIIHNDNISNEYVSEFFKMWNEWQPASSLKPTLTPPITSSPSYTPVPGFDWAISIAGLLAVMYILLRRRG
jgi:phosphatidylserine/phosphatidylglycerophosphate/cardiolipin synthase-like enzyme